MLQTITDKVFPEMVKDEILLEREFRARLGIDPPYELPILPTEQPQLRDDDAPIRTTPAMRKKMRQQALVTKEKDSASKNGLTTSTNTASTSNWPSERAVSARQVPAAQA